MGSPKGQKEKELTTPQEKQYATLENPNYCLIMELSHQYSLNLYWLKIEGTGIKS